MRPTSFLRISWIVLAAALAASAAEAKPAQQTEKAMESTFPFP